MQGTDALDAAGDHDRQLRLLVLSPVPLDSLRTGHGLRVHHILRHLAPRHRITLVHWNDRDQCSPEAGHLPGLRIVACEAPALRRPTGLQRLASAVSLHPPFPAAAAMRRVVDRLLADEGFDALLAFHPALLGVASGVRRIPVVMDLLDEPVLGALRQMRTPGGIAGLGRLVKFLASAVHHERVHLRRVSCCVVVGDDDARSLRFIAPMTPVHVVPNGVDSEYFRPTGASAEPDSLVFTGRMDFPPNAAAALHFGRRILPHIRAARPRVRWTIAGASPPATVLSLAARPGVAVTGFVEDIRPYLESAAIVVSPLISGAGVKTKVLEAWAMARPVVATRLGCAGLDARDGENVRIADQPREFARRVVELLDDTGTAGALGRAGRRTVCERYAWDAQASRVEAIVRGAVAGFRRA